MKERERDCYIARCEEIKEMKERETQRKSKKKDRVNKRLKLQMCFFAILRKKFQLAAKKCDFLRDSVFMPFAI